MEVTSQIYHKMLCNACLSVDQGLKLITDGKMKQFYLEALNEIPECNITNVSPVLCWDCEALLLRAMQFKQRIKESYLVLFNYSCENLNECFLSRQPRLQFKSNYAVDIVPEGPSLVVDSELVKNEVKTDWELKGALASPELSNVIPDTQQIYLKDDLKIEYERDDDIDSNFDSQSDVLDIIDKISKKTKKTKKDLKGKRLKKKDKKVKIYLIDKISKKTKITKKNLKGKRLKKKDKKVKVKRKKETKHPQINTIDLSYEDMMLERESDRLKDVYTKAEYKCEDCILGFNYSKSFKTHLSTKHCKTIGEYVCPVCKTVHATVDSFTAHYKRHMRRYECNICHKRTLDLKVMQQHYYCTHQITLKEYKCGDCGKVSNSIDTHRYHRESHKARLQCLECEKTFRHRAGLLNHRLAVHEFNNKFPCNVCNKVFKWRTSLKRHQYVHENKKPPAALAYCAVCGINFKSVCSYQRHMNNSLKHITKDQLRFICDHCNVKFADKTKLRDHIEEKHLHRTFQCQICLKVSKNRVGLDQHIRNVHKGRPNNKMCHHCGKGFPTKVQLESHIRTHTGERPFSCEYCPTTFSQQSNLYKHNRQVHLNVKSKSYPTCKKKSDATPTDVNTNTAQPSVPVVLHYSAETGYLTAEL